LTSSEGHPLHSAKKVLLRFTSSQANIPPSELELIGAGDGTFSARGAYLSLPGSWQVQAVVRREDKFDAFANYDFMIQMPGSNNRSAASSIRSGGLILAIGLLAALITIAVKPGPGVRFGLGVPLTLLMLSLGVCSLIVYWALGLKYFYLLAMFAGIANILPIAGPISAVVLASAVAIMDSPQKLVGVIIFFAVYFQIESVFLSPRIMRHTLNLSPLTVIIALSLGGALAGVVGALVSVPTAALVMVLADEYLVKRKPAEVAKAAAAD